MSATKYPIWVVNAFSGEAYSGNPAAVVFVDADRDADLSDEERRKIGGQMNLSETAFVTPIKLKPGSAWTPAHASYGLRWFTPDGTEVPLCGHATLATATALFDELKLTAPELSFMTQSGELKVTRHGIEADTGRSQLCMVLPNNAPTPVAECSAEVQAVSSAIVSVVNKALPGALEVMEAQWSGRWADDCDRVRGGGCGGCGGGDSSGDGGSDGGGDGVRWRDWPQPQPSPSPSPLQSSYRYKQLEVQATQAGSLAWWS